ncbi:unnamed protein product [Mytilus edulis]|uniref:Uncharacterized protein n=1 Tax=Mytilus edulis TaxID=6550 RepID=A0A8S3ULL6_MYTED|nr:unnamed protein product [Mytilus edulis]
MDHYQDYSPFRRLNIVTMKKGQLIKRPGNCHGIALIDDQIAVGGDVEGNETDGKSTESKDNLNNKENQKATQNLSDTEFINPYQSIPQETQNTPKDNIGRNDERRKKKKAKKQNQTQSNMSDYVHVVKTSNTTSETVPKTPKSTNVKCLLNVFEKSPVTPPEELHQRENCSKKQKK